MKKTGRFNESPGSYQIDLFEHVAGAYAQPVTGRLSNEELYRISTGRAGIDPSLLEQKQPVGRAGTKRNILKRDIRWKQQSLRALGLLEKVDGQRGIWELTKLGRATLCKIKEDVAVLGFSTNLGIAVLGNCRHVFDRWNEPIFLCLTSPPYPVKKARAYGKICETQYTDFISRILEPIIRNLIPGGSIAINVSNDIFKEGLPSRSLYLEKLTIALCERFGLALMDRLVWENPNKPPGPYQWASRARVQLNYGYEPILWFCNDPRKCIADNRRVLEAHTPAHLKLISSGGELRERINSDGAYRVRQGAYSKLTDGRIPKNVLRVSSTCQSQRIYKRAAKDLGLTAHGAPMPLALARKLIRFLTDVGNLVVDPCAGSMTTPLAAELENRAWVASDTVFDYVRGGAERFRGRDGFDLALGKRPN